MSILWKRKNQTSRVSVFFFLFFPLWSQMSAPSPWVLYEKHCKNSMGGGGLECKIKTKGISFCESNVYSPSLGAGGVGYSPRHQKMRFCFAGLGSSERSVGIFLGVWRGGLQHR